MLFWKQEGNKQYETIKIEHNRRIVFSYPGEDQAVLPVDMWKSTYKYPSTLGNKRECDCSSVLNYLRKPKRRTDVVREDSEEILERFLEEYLLRIYMHKGLLLKPFIFSRRRTSKTQTRSEERIQRLPTFQQEGAEYSGDDNYKMSKNSRFYSQEPVPGQLLYPPVSPRFQPIAKLYTNGQVAELSKPRLVSSVPSFFNHTTVKPNETPKNILRMSSTEPYENKMHEKRIKFSKSSGYLTGNLLMRGRSSGTVNKA